MSQLLIEKLLRVLGGILLFLLVFGMSATVDLDSLKSQYKNTKAVSLALSMQFIGLPLLGYATVKLFGMDSTTGLILLVVVTSPGGSYSNWMCSMFNADLALSVFLTAVSTILSCLILPANLLLYAGLAYGFHREQAEKIDWSVLIQSVITVLLGVTCGVGTSYYYPNHTLLRLSANRLGNYAGEILIIFSGFLSNSSANARLWDRELSFYVGVAVPSSIALFLTNVLAVRCWKLPGPEVVTVSVESCYQNVGIAMSIAMSSGYQGEEMARAVAVPFYYGMWQAALSTIYCTVAWKKGLTKAPVDVTFWKMLNTSYEVKQTMIEESEAKEAPDDGYVYVDAKDGVPQTTSPHWTPTV